MSVIVQCQRIVDGEECGETAEIGMADKSGWYWIPSQEFIAVHLPEGWTVDYVGNDNVIHCPEHAA